LRFRGRLLFAARKGTPWLGGRCSGLPGLLWRSFLKVLEGFEGAKVHAVGGFDAPLQAAEGFESIHIGAAERRLVLERGVGKFGAGKILVEGLELEGPELGLDPAETALGPFRGNERIDERKLGGVGRLVLVKVCGGEGFELGGIFAGNDVGGGVDA
jgi:hypothetical protein